MTSSPAFPQWLRRIDPVLEREDSNALYQAFRLRRKDHRPSLFKRTFASEYRRRAFRGGTGLLKPSRMARFPAWASNLISDAGFSQATVEVWMTPTKGQDLAEAIYLESREMWVADIVAAVCIFGTPLVVYLIVTMFFLDHSLIAIMVMCAAWCWLAWEGSLFGMFVSGRAARSAVAHRFHVIERMSQPSKGIMSELGQILGGCLAVVGIGAVLLLLIILAIAVLANVVIFAAGAIEDIVPTALGGHLFEAGLVPVFLIAALILRTARPGMTKSHISRCDRVFAKCERAYDLYLSRRVMDDQLDAWRWVVSLYGSEPAFKQLHFFSTPD